MRQIYLTARRERAAAALAAADARVSGAPQSLVDDEHEHGRGCTSTAARLSRKEAKPFITLKQAEHHRSRSGERPAKHPGRRRPATRARGRAGRGRRR